MDGKNSGVSQTSAALTGEVLPRHRGLWRGPGREPRAVQLLRLRPPPGPEREPHGSDAIRQAYNRVGGAGSTPATATPDAACCTYDAGVGYLSARQD
ncbi:MAG: hypothetical protein WKG07_11670 [Hymenobacter sp.]